MKNIKISFWLSKIFLVLVIFTYSSVLSGQNIQWSVTNVPPVPFRFEDTYFLNADTGFAVQHYSSNEWGFITKTTDGGNNWTKVLDSTTYEFRNIGFTNELNGFAGTIEHSNVGADTNIIYKTTDGGVTWSGVDNLPGPDSAGICGLDVINDSTIYGVGRYFGPSVFYKTTNNGQTWTFILLDSLVSGLVDLYFFNPDTGFAVGNTGPSYSSGYGRIIYTTDGGDSWSIVHTSSALQTLGWKITFPSRDIGYVSLQTFNFGPTQYFIKTTDGGLTWSDIPYNGGPSSGYFVQGIGFLNDTIGWVGGLSGIFFTQNGGTDWQLQTWGENLNRFRFLSDTLAYAAGKKIYKMQILPTGLDNLTNINNFNNYPNPFNEFTCFEFALKKSMHAKLVIYNVEGKLVDLVFDKIYPAGNHQHIWMTDKLSSGIYVCVLTFGNQIIRQRLEVIR